MEKIVDGRFRIRSLIGEGNFGKVFSARDLKTQKQVAIKLETTTKYSSQLDNEVEVLKYIQGVSGIPQYITSGQWDNYKYLAMQLLGSNLHEIFQQHKKQFSIKSILSLSEQILDRVEYLHSKNYLHRDIKPRQFIAGRGSEIDKIFMIDFGLSKKYQSGELGLHIPYLENRPFVGTAHYASLNVHLGIQHGRRDDLESYVYMLSYLCRGNLPWIDAPKEEQSELKIRIMKSNISADQLFKGAPVEFMTLFSYVKSLQFESKPDYNYMRYLFRSVRVRENIMICMLDWKYTRISRKSRRESKTPPKAEREKSTTRSKPKLVSKTVPSTQHQSAKNLIKKPDQSNIDLLQFKTANSLFVRSSCDISEFGVSHEELYSSPSIHNVHQSRDSSSSPSKPQEDLSGTIKATKYPEIKDRKILPKEYDRKRSRTVANLYPKVWEDICESSMNGSILSRSYCSALRQGRRVISIGYTLFKDF